MKGLFKSLESLGDGNYLSLKDGESAKFVPLVGVDDVIAVDEHYYQAPGAKYGKNFTCLAEEGGKCPLCDMGVSKSRRFYFPVLDIADDNVKILKITGKTAKTFGSLIEEYGEMLNRVFKLTRSGNGLNTSYTVVALKERTEDPEDYELPDIEALVAPKTSEDLKNILEMSINSVDVEDGEEEAPKKVKHPF